MDFSAMVSHFLQDRFDRVHSTFTIVDGYKVPTDGPTESFLGVLVPLSTENLRPEDKGLVKEGDAQLFMLSSIDIEPNDIIMDELGVKYKVMEVINYSVRQGVKQFRLSRLR